MGWHKEKLEAEISEKDEKISELETEVKNLNEKTSESQYNYIKSPTKIVTDLW